MEENPHLIEKESPAEEECEFKKGICKKRNMKGIRKVITSKKWTKKKDGLQGWSYSKKVKWYCQFNEIVTPASPEIASNGIENYPHSQAAPLIERESNGLSDNLLGDYPDTGEVGERPELSESTEKGSDWIVISKD